MGGGARLLTGAGDGVGGEGSPPILEHTLQVSRTARYAVLGGGGGAGDLWIVLHGYRQLARFFLRRFSSVATGHRRVVAPEGLSRFYLDDSGGGPHGPDHRVGATWMTREHREAEIQDYVAYLDRLHERVREGRGPASLVLGFSQGVHTAARWVALGAVRPARLVLWGAGLPDDLDVRSFARAMEGGEVILVRGETDSMHTAASVQGAMDRLGDHGLRVTERTHPGGHRIEGGLLEALASESRPSSAG